jgi:dTMP kinase
VPAAAVTVQPPEHAAPGLAARWVSLEGIEGVGKTYLAGQLAGRLGPRCTLVSEVTDHGCATMAGQIVTALSACGDAFLRTGHPLTETFALLALKVHAFSQVTAAPGGDPEIVLEDRGPDTVAVYQAAILQPAGNLPDTFELAQRISAAAARWRPFPDLTLLLTDDPNACEERFTRRLGRPLQLGERTLMTRAAELYALQAAADPGRYAVIDRRGRTTEETLAEMADICRIRTVRRDDDT